MARLKAPCRNYNSRLPPAIVSVAHDHVTAADLAACEYFTPWLVGHSASTGLG